MISPYTPRQMTMVRMFARQFRGYLNSDPLFGQLLRRDLLSMLGGNAEAVELVEVSCLVGQYHDHQMHAQLNAEVLRKSHQMGVRRTRGKRTKPELAGMVSDLVGLLLALGVPLTVPQKPRTKYVMLHVIEAVHTELQMRGDPRNELRRLIRQQKTAEAATKAARDRAAMAYRRGYARGLGFSDDDPQPKL